MYFNAATIEPSEPQHDANGGSVWFRITPTVTGPMIFDAGSKSTPFSIEVYAGTDLGSLVRNPGTQVTSTSGNAVSVPVVSGQAYAVAVVAKGAGTGQLALSWTCPVCSSGLATPRLALVPEARPFAGMVQIIDLDTERVASEPTIGASVATLATGFDGDVVFGLVDNALVKFTIADG